LSIRTDLGENCGKPGNAEVHVTPPGGAGQMVALADDKTSATASVRLGSSIGLQCSGKSAIEPFSGIRGSKRIVGE